MLADGRGRGAGVHLGSREGKGVVWMMVWPSACVPACPLMCVALPVPPHVCGPPCVPPLTPLPTPLTCPACCPPHVCGPPCSFPPSPPPTLPQGIYFLRQFPGGLQWLDIWLSFKARNIGHDQDGLNAVVRGQTFRGDKVGGWSGGGY